MSSSPEEKTGKPSEKALKALIRHWKTDQAIVEKLVQVYEDPTTKQQNHDRICSAKAVEDNAWCQVLKPSYPDAGGDTDNFYYYGGVDIGWPNPTTNIAEKDQFAVAVYVIVDSRTMKVVYRDQEWISMDKIPPYVSTYLSFREIDPLQRLVEQQTTTRPELTPRAILVDGNGIFHPRHSGIACFLGVRTEIPTIGIGKTLLWIGNGTEANETEDEYQWTRKKLDERIAQVLGEVHRRVVSGSKIDTELAKRLKAHKGPILPKGSNDGEIDSEEATSLRSREELLEDLYPFCNGIAIPLEAPAQTDANHRFKILGAALVGHGGSKARFGSKRPIIVSVGHRLSLVEAVSVTANMSLFRIPEPVRQADLYGRDLLRKRGML